MTVGKTLELTRSDDQSITVSSGTDTFTIAFCEVPRVSDNVERRFQRVRKPLVDFNELKEGWPGPSGYFPFTIYDPQTEGNTEGEQKGSGSHFLAIQDDKAFAIRMMGDCKDSAFKVKVRVGGVNVLQHTTQGNKTQDYFVVSEQKWVWGKQVDKNTARQFRVFRRGRERLSLRCQLRNNNTKKEVEIEITSRRLARPTELWSYWPPPRMTLGNEDDLIPQPASPPPAPPPQQPAYQAPPCHHAASSAPYYDAMPAPQANFQGPTSDDTGPSTTYGYTMLPPPPPPLTASHELAYDDPVSHSETRPSKRAKHARKPTMDVAADNQTTEKQAPASEHTQQAASAEPESNNTESNTTTESSVEAGKQPSTPLPVPTNRRGRKQSLTEDPSKTWPYL